MWMASEVWRRAARAALSQRRAGGGGQGRVGLRAAGARSRSEVTRWSRPREERAWRLAIESPGTLESLALVPAVGGGVSLGPGQVRVAVRAAGLNFKDVVVALGLVEPPDSEVGIEGAGVVVEVGSGCERSGGRRSGVGVDPGCVRAGGGGRSPSSWCGSRRVGRLRRRRRCRRCS